MRKEIWKANREKFIQVYMETYRQNGTSDDLTIKLNMTRNQLRCMKYGLRRFFGIDLPKLKKAKSQNKKIVPQF